MKKITLSIVTLISFSALASFAGTITVTSEDKTVNVARVVQVVTLVNKPSIMVNVSVVDNGGSTDLSPTQEVYLNLYSKGEMFSTDAAFKIADVLSVKSARRVSGGIYEVVVNGLFVAGQQTELSDVTLIVDAKNAVTAIQKVQCGDEFDCDASTNFTSTVEVQTK
jgi:hypothetical protein